MSAAANADAAAALRTLVEAEARRTAALQPAADPARLADGWQRRFSADGARADEAAALYAELGYDVVADQVSPRELPAGCDGCRVVALLAMKTVYTRERREAP